MQDREPTATADGAPRPLAAKTGHIIQRASGNLIRLLCRPAVLSVSGKELNNLIFGYPLGGQKIKKLHF